MATDTPNFNWPIPEDTDLVKDGAKAIRDLGNAIDTSAQDFGGGLVHIETRTVSAVAAESFNNVFNSDFQNYKIIINLNATGNESVRFRLRVGGTDDTGTNYEFVNTTFSGSSASVSSAPANNIFVLNMRNTHKSNGIIELFNPFLVSKTGLDISYQRTSSPVEKGVIAGEHSLSTSYDGFTLFPDTSNMTGTISIYGYAKA